MKYTILLIGLLFMFCQGQIVDKNIDINISATMPQVLLDEIYNINVIIDKVPHGTAVHLASGMTLAEVNALNLSLQTQVAFAGFPASVTYILPADGGDFVVGAIASNSLGQAISKEVSPYTIGDLVLGVSPVTTLPMQQNVNHVPYMMNVTVTIR